MNFFGAATWLGSRVFYYNLWFGIRSIKCD